MYGLMLGVVLTTGFAEALWGATTSHTTQVGPREEGSLTWPILAWRGSSR